MIHGFPKEPEGGVAPIRSGESAPGEFPLGEVVSGGESFPALTLDLLGPDPLTVFAEWFEVAQRLSNARYPDAMTLSTIDAEGWPEGRIVLLKGVDTRGFSFFTNYRSRKARGIDAHGRGALTFYWGDLKRQVRVQGEIERLSAEESDEYFRSRPRGSQIGAWASEQSEPLESRAVLEARAQQLESHHAEGEVPRPPHWGGYLLSPHEIEFWQEGESRLHDRFRYRRTREGEWGVERLNP